MANGSRPCPRCGLEWTDYSIWEASAIAALLGVSENTVRGWWAKGLLPFRFRVQPYARFSFGYQLAAFLLRWYPGPEDLDPNSPDKHIQRLLKVLRFKRGAVRKVA